MYIYKHERIMYVCMLTMLWSVLNICQLNLAMLYNINRPELVVEFGCFSRAVTVTTRPTCVRPLLP